MKIFSELKTGRENISGKIISSCSWHFLQNKIKHQTYFFKTERRTQTPGSTCMNNWASDQNLVWWDKNYDEQVKVRNKWCWVWRVNTWHCPGMIYIVMSPCPPSTWSDIDWMIIIWPGAQQHNGLLGVLCPVVWAHSVGTAHSSLLSLYIDMQISH